MSKVRDQYGIQLLKLNKAIQYNIDCIEQHARQKACITHCVTSIDWTSTMHQIEAIDKLLCRRDTLVYLQQSISDSVCSLPLSLRTLLRLVYIQKVDKEQASVCLGYSVRTLYRRLDIAKDMLHKALTDRGISYQWLLDNVKPIADIAF